MNDSTHDTRVTVFTKFVKLLEKLSFMKISEFDMFDKDIFSCKLICLCGYKKCEVFLL